MEEADTVSSAIVNCVFIIKQAFNFVEQEADCKTFVAKGKVIRFSMKTFDYKCLNIT